MQNDHLSTVQNAENMLYGKHNIIHGSTPTHTSYAHFLASSKCHLPRAILQLTEIKLQTNNDIMSEVLVKRQSVSMLELDNNLIQ